MTIVSREHNTAVQKRDKSWCIEWIHWLTESDHWIHASDENCSQKINKRKGGDRDGASTLKEKQKERKQHWVGQINIRAVVESRLGGRGYWDWGRETSSSRWQVGHCPSANPIEIKFKITKDKKFITVFQPGRNVHKPLVLMDFRKTENTLWIKIQEQSRVGCAHTETAIETETKLPAGDASRMLPTLRSKFSFMKG